MTVIIDGSGSAAFATPLPVTEGGTGATAATGSGDVVLSASPTLTGTVTLDTPLPVASGGTGVASNVGTVASVNMLQTRTQGTYAASNSGNGTEITPLNITFTPKKAGNKVILDFTINSDSHQDMVFLVSRNDVLLTDATNGSNNRWAGIAAMNYDQNQDSTPYTLSVRILDLNTLATASTYKVQVRSSSTGNYTFYLNRVPANTGADAYEAMLSVATATEIWA